VCVFVCVCACVCVCVCVYVNNRQQQMTTSTRANPTTRTPGGPIQVWLAGLSDPIHSPARGPANHGVHINEPTRARSPTILTMRRPRHVARFRSQRHKHAVTSNGHAVREVSDANLPRRRAFPCGLDTRRCVPVQWVPGVDHSHRASSRT
jgi:hypothetical protein